jgi:hypothetical protein
LKEFRGPEIESKDINIVKRIGVDDNNENKGQQSTVYKAIVFGTEVCVKGLFLTQTFS